MRQKHGRRQGLRLYFSLIPKSARRDLELAGIQYENEIQTNKIGFCKLETQQECLAGTLCIPRLLDVLGSRYRIYFFSESRSCCTCR